MEGLEAAEVNKSRIIQENDILRLDSQYFKKEYLKEDLNRKKYENKYLGQIAFITDGQHGYHEVDESSPIRHLTAKNAKGWFANDVDADRIAKWVDDNNRRSSLEKDDLILSTRGTVGLCAIIDSDILPSNIDQDVARIKFENTKILPTVALTYLNCRVGQDWLERNQTGMVQQGIALWRVREIPLPVFSETLQNAIDRIIRNSKAIKNKSKESYKSAESLLLETLGLSNFAPNTEPVNVKGFKESFLTTGRLDAEYYQKKYEDTKAQVHQSAKEMKFEIKQLSQIATNPKYGSSTKLDYIENGVPFLRIADLEDKRFNSKNLKYISHEAAKKEASAKVKTNDILISRSGTLGLSVLITEELDNAIYGSYFIKVTPNPKKINPKYLAFYLNSKIGQLQVEQQNTGGIQTNLTIPVIESLYVVIPDDESQKRIIDLIDQSFHLKKQSERLLETAKRAVEIAIEENEDAAMGYIEEQQKDASGITCL